MRQKAISALKTSREISESGPGSYSQIWEKIDELAKPVYTDLKQINILIEDKYNDYENDGKHCSVTHKPLSPSTLEELITSFRGII
jgi:hypothetical protein